jgi:hypothetical protein
MKYWILSGLLVPFTAFTIGLRINQWQWWFLMFVMHSLPYLKKRIDGELLSEVE